MYKEKVGIKLKQNTLELLQIGFVCLSAMTGMKLMQISCQQITVRWEAAVSLQTQIPFGNILLLVTSLLQEEQAARSLNCGKPSKGHAAV